MKLNLSPRPARLLQKLALAIVSMGAIGPVAAAPDNQGREFVLGFMENYDGGGSVSFYLTAPKSTTVTVQGAGFGPATFPVDAGTVTPVTLPVAVRAAGSGTIENKGLLLSAPDEFVVYGLNQKVFSTDAYLGLPTDVAGTEYLVPSMPNAKKSLPGELQIIAQEDGTEITITPKKSTIAGADVKSIKAGKSARFTLNRLQSIQFKAKGGYTADLTGSVITSSKPVSVFSGHQCGIVPSRALACDHLVEQIPPITTWGTEFLTTPLATRTGGDIFRILAAHDGTEVRIDGAVVARLKRGKFKQVNLASGSFHQITTSAPALVVQYSKGTSADRVVSDPFMMIIPPTEQFGSDYFVSTPPVEPVAFNNFINIVAPTDQLAGLRLDEAPIPDTAFTLPFAAIGSTGYSGTQLKVGIGAHTISHLSPIVPFGVFSYGFADSDSYGYPGGNRLANIANPCTPAETEQGDGIDNDCDHKIDEELFNERDDDGDGKVDEDLAKAQPPLVNAGGPYTVNEGSSIQLNGTAVAGPGDSQLTYEWDLDNNGTFETLGATPTFAGLDGPVVQTVTLRVTGLGGSNQAATTVTVNNVAPTINIQTSSLNSCVPVSSPNSFTYNQELKVFFDDPAIDKENYSVKLDWQYPDFQTVMAVTNFPSSQISLDPYSISYHSGDSIPFPTPLLEALSQNFWTYIFDYLYLYRLGSSPELNNPDFAIRVTVSVSDGAENSNPVTLIDSCTDALQAG
ncbi:MAG: hypothetical protein ACR65R_20910 [Methylomicrobium sp.]